MVSALTHLRHKQVKHVKGERNEVRYPFYLGQEQAVAQGNEEICIQS